MSEFILFGWLLTKLDMQPFGRGCLFLYKKLVKFSVSLFLIRYIKNNSSYSLLWFCILSVLENIRENFIFATMHVNVIQFVGNFLSFQYFVFEKFAIFLFLFIFS